MGAAGEATKRTTRRRSTEGEAIWGQRIRGAARPWSEIRAGIKARSAHEVTRWALEFGLLGYGGSRGEAGWLWDVDFRHRLGWMEGRGPAGCHPWKTEDALIDVLALFGGELE